MRLPILQSDPKAAYLAYQQGIDAAIRRVLDRGWFILGEETARFEQEFAAYLGARHAIGVANGTEALELALRACEVGPGDLVITASHTAVATAAAIDLVGAIPVLVDIDPATYTLDADRLTETIQLYAARGQVGGPGGLKAVIPVHLYGHPAPLPIILDLARRFGLRVIEDCAQSHGARYQGKPTGVWGDLGAFSFYPTKNLGALGDGGMVVSNDDDLGERVRLLREYGWKERYVSSLRGKNSRLDEVQAAILRVKLPDLEPANERRRQVAARYQAMLSGLPLRRPECHPDALHVYHQYVVRTPNRDDLRTFLRDQKVGTLVHYPVPVHQQAAYQSHYRPGAGGLGHTEAVCRQVLSLPMHSELTGEQLDYIAEVIRRWQPPAEPKG
ncbi:MAG: DegT/DnrJ/EryC1/StrS family aminotransferase [Verrucomicrobia bacterium]|nr:DegT/DnrJ/EryC1/StrS family aminotransferase [Verrucomicrobiota bacterium]